MSEFAPPSGPPPPKVPEGWKAVWNDQYSEWFYVNIYTKKSQWDKPDHPVYPPGEAPPDGPPPTYAPSTSSPAPTDDKKLSSNNPYALEVRKSQDLSEDERLARQLQDEENARAHGQGDNRGMADAYYGQQQQQGGYGQGNTYPPQDSTPYAHQSPSPFQQQQSYEADKGKSKGGLLGKLLGKTSSKPSYGAPGGYQQNPYQQPGYGAPGGYYPQGQPSYGQPGYYPQQQMYGQPARKKPGMGAGGAAALGLGGGLLGGALIGSALADDHGDTYVENNYGDDGGDGGDFGGDDGGDFGGGDF